MSPIPLEPDGGGVGGDKDDQPDKAAEHGDPKKVAFANPFIMIASRPRTRCPVQFLPVH
jgi:hypothetical protein